MQALVLHQQTQLQLYPAALTKLKACWAGFSLSHGQDWCLHAGSMRCGESASLVALVCKAKLPSWIP